MKMEIPPGKILWKRGGGKLLGWQLVKILAGQNKWVLWSVLVGSGLVLGITGPVLGILGLVLGDPGPTWALPGSVLGNTVLSRRRGENA